jgi:type III restriction enzyme
LLAFDTLTSDQKQLAMKAWVWGVMKENKHQTHQVDLWNEGKEVLQSFKVKTIKLKEMSEQQLQKNHSFVDLQECNYTQSIFNLHKQLANCDEELQKDCYDYVGNDYSKWFKYTEVLPSIKKEYVNFHINYGKSMEIDKEVSFPISSSFSGDDHSVDVPNWVWVKKNGSESFAFDSEAEMKWAVFMGDLCGKQAEVLTEDEEDRYLWGKNFPTNSEIRYQYYSSGIHSSYPDFIMKDKSGKIHIFEVKSFNEATGSPIKEAEYKEKVEKLKECYLACSAKLENYCFYIPILDGDEWVVYAYIGGKEVVGIKTKKDVKTFIKSQNNL